jgi:hypothetical protein
MTMEPALIGAVLMAVEATSPYQTSTARARGHVVGPGAMIARRSTRCWRHIVRSRGSIALYLRIGRPI